MSQDSRPSDDLVWCPACDGEKWDDLDNRCSYCDGTGKVTPTQREDYRPPRAEELL